MERAKKIIGNLPAFVVQHSSSLACLNVAVIPLCHAAATTLSKSCTCSPYVILQRPRRPVRDKPWGGLEQVFSVKKASRDKASR